MSHDDAKKFIKFQLKYGASAWFSQAVVGKLLNIDNSTFELCVMNTDGETKFNQKIKFTIENEIAHNAIDSFLDRNGVDRQYIDTNLLIIRDDDGSDMLKKMLPISFTELMLAIAHAANSDAGLCLWLSY